jgi:hypothetical protein
MPEKTEPTNTILQDGEIEAIASVQRSIAFLVSQRNRLSKTPGHPALGGLRSEYGQCLELLSAELAHIKRSQG